jgi:hypothetical protein
MVGFHFRFQLRIDWPALVNLFDERAKLLGCVPSGMPPRPRAHRATVSGTIDKRLERGGLRYDFVLYSQEGQIVDVQLGRIGDPIGIRFGVDARASGDWRSHDTLGFSSSGLFMPEQRTVDDKATLPAAYIARIELWSTLSSLAAIATGAPVPSSLELATAPGWRFSGASNDLNPALHHPLAGLSFDITPMMTGAPASLIPLK